MSGDARRSDAVASRPSAMRAADPRASLRDPMRRVLVRTIAAGGVGAWLAPAAATPDAMRAAIDAFTRGAAISEGGLRLDVPELVENGNSVPVSVTVDSPMTDVQHVRRIALFTERNPQPQVAVFTLGPRSGRARVATRIRMADSQRLVALAELSDGSFRRHAVDVIVTLAACLE